MKYGWSVSGFIMVVIFIMSVRGGGIRVDGRKKF